jgi:glutamate 5-kinase
MQTKKNNFQEEPQRNDRKEYILKSKRIVLKLGTKVLLSHYLQGGKDGHISRFIDDIADYHRQGYQIAIVSSGAVGFGMNQIGLEQRPEDLKRIQALASMGQSMLMQQWNELFAQRGLKTGQILLTYDIIENRKRFLYARDCMLSLFKYGAIPIINENDSVAIDELKFGDNDTLSVLVSSLMDADLLVMFTDTDGLFTKNPHRSRDSKRIGYLDKIDKDIFDLIDDKKGNLSLGGMTSKLQAALRSTQGGAGVVICNGFTPDLKKILSGEDIGTYIRPDKKYQKKRKRWISFNDRIKGKVIIDKGAETALVRNQKSLLPGGVVSIEGNFPVGSVVGIYNTNHEPVGKGISYYSSQEIDRIKGQRTGNINKDTVKRFYHEIIHRDNMIILKEETRNHDA